MYTCSDPKCNNECDYDEREIHATCGDCGAKVGVVHMENCDVQRCTGCGGQRLSCSCGSKMDDGSTSQDNHDPEKAKWDGHWPNTVEASKEKVCLNHYYTPQDKARMT